MTGAPHAHRRAAAVGACCARSCTCARRSRSSFPLSTLDTALAVALAARASARCSARAVAASRLRLPTIALARRCCSGWSPSAARCCSASALFAAWLGPARGARASPARSARALGAALRRAARCARRRCARRCFACSRSPFVGMAFAQLVVGHRGGAINRPFELADSIIAQGGDPTLALLLVGAVAAAACVTLLLSERSAVALAAAPVARARAAAARCSARRACSGCRRPSSAQTGLGLRPDEKDGKPHDRTAAAASRASAAASSDNEQLDFQDNYDSRAGKSRSRSCCCTTTTRRRPASTTSARSRSASTTASAWCRPRAATSTRTSRRASCSSRPSSPTCRTTQGDRTRLETTVALLADHNRPFALESPARASSRPTNPDPGRFRRAYRVVSEALDAELEALLGRGVGDPHWSEEQRAHYTQRRPTTRATPSSRTRSCRAARRTCARTRWRRALMVSLWLSKQGTYSLKSGHASADDPTADFLFGDRTGYCVHFAHAAVYLMRSLGVPARVGAGYAVEEAARQGGSAILLVGRELARLARDLRRRRGLGGRRRARPSAALDPPPQPPDADLQRLLGELARGISRCRSRVAPARARVRSAAQAAGTLRGALGPRLLGCSSLVGSTCQAVAACRAGSRRRAAAARGLPRGARSPDRGGARAAAAASRARRSRARVARRELPRSRS